MIASAACTRHSRLDSTRLYQRNHARQRRTRFDEKRREWALIISRQGNSFTSGKLPIRKPTTTLSSFVLSSFHSYERRIFQVIIRNRMTNCNFFRYISNISVYLIIWGGFSRCNWRLEALLLLFLSFGAPRFVIRLPHYFFISFLRKENLSNNYSK